MACGCGSPGCGGDPCGALPREQQFTQQTSQTYSRTLSRKLIGPVDRLRDLFTRFGERPYVVRLVTTRWSGGAKGMGQESVVSETQILPTPLVLDISGVQSIVTPIGADDQGGLLLTEISGCYTEEQLGGLQSDGTPLPADQGFYFEIEFLRADGVDGERRRFAVGGVPEYDADQFCWRLRLERSRPDRSRRGMPSR